MIRTHFVLRHPTTNETRTVTSGQAVMALHADGWKLIEIF